MGSKHLIRNKDARTYVAMRQPFQGSNLYAENVGIHKGPTEIVHAFYAVYSYGPHFPLFVCDLRDGTWYENEDRYSMTTSHHRSNAHPLADTVKVSTAALKRLLDTGVKPGEA